jgi:SHS family lactate transporter-like MFS transporter
MLKVQYGFSSTQVTITQIIANIGAIFGGTLCGWVSQIVGRRLSIIIICIIGGALIYPYTFVKGNAMIASAFFEQFMVQGIAAIVPLHMLELSPASSCTFVVGVAYQLGNLASSASSTIESTIGELFPLHSTGPGQHRYNYGKVICIFLGCVFTYLILIALVGPERLGRRFDPEEDSDVVENLAIRGGEFDLERPM